MFSVGLWLESGKICKNNNHTCLFHCIKHLLPSPSGRCLNTRPNGIMLKQLPRDWATVKAWKNLCDPYINWSLGLMIEYSGISLCLDKLIQVKFKKSWYLMRLSIVKFCTADLWWLVPGLKLLELLSWETWLCCMWTTKARSLISASDYHFLTNIMHLVTYKISII